MKENENNLTCFKAYDVRGELGVNFDASVVYRIGVAVAQHFNARVIVVGRDARQSSPELAKALIKGIISCGTNVLDIGLAGTEEMYWAVTEFKACAGIEVTASHNPINHNGLKIVKSGSQPLDDKQDFQVIKKLTLSNNSKFRGSIGMVTDLSFMARKAYVKKIMSFTNLCESRPLKIVVNAGNGAAGPTFDAVSDELLKDKLPIEFIRMHHEPNHLFPNGIPNPLLVDNHSPTRKMILKHKPTNRKFVIYRQHPFDIIPIITKSNNNIKFDLLLNWLFFPYCQIKQLYGTQAILQNRFSKNKRIIVTTQDIPTKLCEKLNIREKNIMKIESVDQHVKIYTKCRYKTTKMTK